MISPVSNQCLSIRFLKYCKKISTIMPDVGEPIAIPSSGFSTSCQIGSNFGGALL
jgi:hypothetical protein